MRSANRLITFLILFVFVASCKKNNDLTNNNPPPPPPYTGYNLSGKVIDANGNGIANIKIVYDASKFVYTDATGQFEIDSVEGNQVLRPQDSSYLFSPDTLQVTAADSNSISISAVKKSFPSMLHEKIISWFNHMQLSNGLVQTSENSNLVSLYDNALSAMVFLEAGETDRAEKIFDYFNGRVNSELLSGDGGFSQFRDANGNPNNHRWLGDNAWFLIALNNYAAKTNSTKYQAMADDIAAWIESLQDVDGGLWGGYDEAGAQIGKITEGMIDAFNAVPGYTSFHSNLLNYFQAYRWDTTDQMLVCFPGDYYKYAMDNNSWGYCSIQDFQYNVLEKTSMYQNTQTATLNGDLVTGFAPDIDKDVVWVEGTGQMAVAFRKANNVSSSNYYLQQIMQLAVKSTIYSNSWSLVVASNIGTGYGSDPFWSGADLYPGTAPGAWFIFGMLQFDPMAVGYQKNIPTADEFWIP